MRAQAAATALQMRYRAKLPPDHCRRAGGAAIGPWSNAVAGRALPHATVYKLSIWRSMASGPSASTRRRILQEERLQRVLAQQHRRDQKRGWVHRYPGRRLGPDEQVEAKSSGGPLPPVFGIHLCQRAARL